MRYAREVERKGRAPVGAQKRSIDGTSFSSMNTASAFTASMVMSARKATTLMTPCSDACNTCNVSVIEQPPTALISSVRSKGRHCTPPAFQANRTRSAEAPASPDVVAIGALINSRLRTSNISNKSMSKEQSLYMQTSKACY